MKNDFETHLKNAVEVEGLPEEARIRMRALLSEYAAMQPRRERIPTRDTTAPWIVAILEVFRTLVTRRAAVALILVLFFGTSGSLAYAAEGTLPGNPLYALKVDITEPVRSAFIVNPGAQADWQITLATRRANEAATLASRGALSTSTQEDLATRFSQDIATARIALARTDTSTNTDDVPANDVQSISTMRLAGYVKVFDTINRQHPQTANRAFRDTIALAITDLASSGATTAATPTLLVATTTATTSVAHGASTSDAQAQRLRDGVERALAQSNAQIAQMETLLASSTSVRARAQLKGASTRALDGEKLLSEGDSVQAARAYRDALGITAQLNVLLYAATQLHIDAFTDTSTSTTSTNTTSTSTSAQNFVLSTTTKSSTSKNTSSSGSVSDSVSISSSSSISKSSASTTVHKSSTPKLPVVSPVVPKIKL